MVDPRLNSVHLDFPRRHVFRRAREGLFHAQGAQTLLAERERGEGLSGRPRTAVEQGAALLGVDCWLMDGEFIYPLTVGFNTIGRAPDNDIVLADGYVSRRHCTILVHARDGAELHDTASKNGTYLNGNKLFGPTPLHSGDEIRMCDRHLVFVSREDHPPSPSPTGTIPD
jgi:FHA domain